MKILITGINGNLGTYCAKFFSIKNFEIFGITKSNSNSNFLENKNILIFPSNDIDKIDKIINEVDIILHFAAATGFDKSDYEYINSNFISSIKLIELIKKNKNNNIKKIIFTSTSSVYGEGQYLCKNHNIVDKVFRRISDLNNHIWNPLCPFCNSEISSISTNENCDISSSHIYSSTKNMSEKIFQHFSLNYNINITILRFPILFGNKKGHGLIPLFVDKIINNKKILLNEDGNQLRDFFSYENCVKVINHLIFNDSKKLIYNLGSGSSISLIKLLAFISNQLKIKADIDISNEYREGDVRNIFLDNKLFSSEFNNLSLSSFESTLSSTIKDIISEKN